MGKRCKLLMLYLALFIADKKFERVVCVESSNMGLLHVSLPVVAADYRRTMCTATFSSHVHVDSFAQSQVSLPMIFVISKLLFNNLAASNSFSVE